MSHRFLLPKAAERAISFVLIAGIVFFSPYSVVLEVSLVRAEDATANMSQSSSDSSSGAPDSKGSSGSESPSDSSEDASDVSDESDSPDSSDVSGESGVSGDTDDSVGGSVPENADASQPVEDKAVANEDAPASADTEDTAPGDTALSDNTAISGTSTEESRIADGETQAQAAASSTASSTSLTGSAAATTTGTGDGGDGGESGAGGDGGNGGNAGGGGATGDQGGSATTTTSGGMGGSGGGPAESLTLIDTGTSTVEGTVENSINMSSSTLSVAGATTTATTSANIDIRNDNAATTTNDMEIESQTGENAATTTGEAVVRTGDAIANANLLNVVNTNLVNSFGELLFLSNLWKSSIDNLDLRELDFWSGGGGSGFPALFCSLLIECRRSGFDIRNDNSATTTNGVDVDAATGGNTVFSNGSNATLTGDAYAAANIINLINANFVDSNYLFMTYNSFGDWGGDIVFPSAEAFLKAFSGSGSSSPVSVDFRGHNDTDIVDDLSVSADTGGNTTTSDGGWIRTGTSSTVTNVLTAANQNYLGGTSLNLLFKVHGDWSGKVYGLPPGVTWKKTADGFVLSFEELEEAAADGDQLGLGLDIRDSNNAYLENAGTVTARTGGNAATSTDGNSYIDTGDAYAAANVINVANTNVVGRNMFWAIVNIFGDWSGDVAFGKPDLWIGGHAEVDGSSLLPGHEATYHFTVINNGDIAATDVKVSADLGSDYLNSTESGLRSVEVGVGTLSPGESKSVSFAAKLSTDAPHDTELVTTVAKASAAEKDANLSDNEEEVSVTIGRLGSSRGGGVSWSKPIPLQRTAAASTMAQALPRLTVTKFDSAEGAISASSSVSYKVVVHNGSDMPAENAKLYDRLTDAYGAVVNEDVWILGTILPNEEITIEYSVFFQPATPGGFYTNSAYVTAFASSTAITSNIAMTTIKVDPLGIATPVAGELTATSVPVLADPNYSATTSTSSVIFLEPESSSSFVPQTALAAGDSLLAAAFFATPTGKQLTILTVGLVALALALAGIRRRLYL